MLKYTNRDIRDFVYELHSMLIKKNPEGDIYPPVIDMTGISTELDYSATSEVREYYENYDLDAFLDFMDGLGLYLEKGTKPMKVVVIRDPKDDL